MSNAQMVRASILFGLLIPCCSSGQPFRAFPDSNAVWMMDYYVGPDYWDSYAYHLETNNHDTLINGQWYNVLMAGLEGEPSLFAGGIREDGNGKVFYYHGITDSTYLLYDFEALAGDSMEVWVGLEYYESPSTIMMHVCSVETLTLATCSYRILSIQSVDPLTGCIGFDQWVTGVGGYGGILNTLANPYAFDRTRLACMSHNDTLWYVTPGTCASTIAIEEHPVQHILSHPNPSNRLFTLSTASNLTDQVLVYDPHGREVLRTREKTIDLGAHPPGVYTAVVTTAQGRQAVRLVLLR